MRLQITPAIARDYALRSHAVRRAAKAELERLRDEAQQRRLAALNAPPPAHNERILRTERQMMRIDELIDNTEDGLELSRLIQSKERLLDVWSLLTGYPRPGIRRAARRSNPLFEAQPAQPEVDPHEDPPDATPSLPTT